MIRDQKWFAWTVVSLYLGAIVLANYLITTYGQVALPWVAFALIPFDLVARDLMQDRWQNEPTYVLRWRMLILILCGGLISIWTGTGSVRVNVASWLAFTIAGLIDALTYQGMIRYGRVFRINAATLTAAITDSIIFVTIAFNEVNWKLVGLQIGMKVAGGFVWSLLLYKFFRRPLNVEQMVDPKNIKTVGEPMYVLPECRPMTLEEYRERTRFGIDLPPFHRRCWLCFDDGIAICDCHNFRTGGPEAPCNLVCN